MRRALGWLCLLGLGCGVAWGAAGAASIPPDLQPWQGWVLHGHEQAACPLLAAQAAGERQCVWPGRLSLDAGASGARFTLAVHVDADGWVALPGERDAWPQQVALDGTPAIVLDRDGTPSVWLAVGDHQLAGSLQWNERPPRLQVPASIALVALTIDGKPVEQPARDGDWLTLGEPATRQREADSLDVRVFRKLEDGLPPLLQTQIELHVSGSAREQALGPVLPAGFVATALAGGLPARLDADGSLRLQLRPGNWVVSIAARGSRPLAKVALHAAPAPWPAQEVWSYADAPGLRATRAVGAQPIDPAQAGVPAAWRRLPAFVMARASVLEVQQRARGASANAGPRLQLDRALWLDFNGGGWSADDHLTGTLGSIGRLDVGAPWTLERAQDADAAAPLLVTRGAARGSTGVELRSDDGALDLHAGLRRAGRGGAASAAGGWQQTFDRVDATVHLPYGYRLLAAPGADLSPDSWVAGWNLLDLFVAAVIALLAWRLLGWRWALAVLAFVALSHGEPGAPRWTPALALAFGLAARVLPQGKLRTVARALGIAMLVLAAIATLPFATVQVRDALHPQLEEHPLAWIAPAPQGVAADRVAGIAPQQAKIAFAPPPPAAPPPPQEQSAMSAPARADASQSLQTIVVTGSRIKATDLAVAAGYPPDMVVQAGRGVPDWSQYGSAYRLGWSGPVTVQQTFRMLILPSWATRILRLVMLLLLVGWLLATARALDVRVRLPRQRVLGAAGAGMFLLAMLCGPQARAQALPSQDLLAQLQSRLLEAPACAPGCASAPLAKVALQGDSLELTLEVDAATQVAFPLPTMDVPASLRDVRLDGKAATQLVRRDGAPWISLARGVHRVVLDFRLDAGSASAALHFPMPPPNVSLAAPGWQVAGNDGVRLLADTLMFTRAGSSSRAGTAAAPVQAFPAYVKLTRHIAIGLDSKIDNAVTRIAPASDGFTVELPLLPGEHVLTPGLKVRNGSVQLTFGSGESEAGWSSTLGPARSLRLVAPPLGARAEVWQVASGPMLHLAFSGVPEAAGHGSIHEFRPLPGETLDVSISRPAAVPGASIAFDSVALDVERGMHAEDATLTLATRSTRGGEQAIELPPDARVLGVQRDGQPLELDSHAGHLALPVQPGKQSFSVRFRQTGPLALVSRTPRVSLGAPAANIQATLALPHDRWVLWTFGPRAGPAVLYWSQLVVLLVVAIVLARCAPTPLRWWHWLLLGLGFSTFAWTAFVIVAAWLVVLGLRERSTRVAALARSPFNVLQVLLAVLTLLALACLVASVPHGLLGRPDMRITGDGSGSWTLRWFADQASGFLPRAGAFTLPLWVYKAAMLAWALWLANALIGWLRWGFHAWMRGGYWKSAAPQTKATLAERVTAKDGNAGS